MAQTEPVFEAFAGVPPRLQARWGMILSAASPERRVIPNDVAAPVALVTRRADESAWWQLARHRDLSGTGAYSYHLLVSQRAFFESVADFLCGFRRAGQR